VTNVFSKKILAKRALREIKLLQHFRGHRNVGPPRKMLVRMLTAYRSLVSLTWTFLGQITTMRHIFTKVRRRSQASSVSSNIDQS
jgi:hypothetical protein